MPGLNIHGVLPPMFTPFKENGEIDIDAHVRNLARWNEAPLGGYLVLGSNGETPYLSEAEKRSLIDLTVKHAAEGRTIIAGTGLESTRETIRLTKFAAESGVHAALVLTPCFYGGQMNDEAQINHFRRVADASKIPILIYNVPAYTRLVISIDAVTTLSEHENIIGMKDSSGDVPRLEAILKVVPKSFHFIMGSASAWYPALERGVRAGILALSNIAGKECAEVQKLYEHGKQKDAEALHRKLIPVNAAVTASHGIAGLKYAAALLGYDSGVVRSPLLELSQTAKDDIRLIVTNAGLL